MDFFRTLIRQVTDIVRRGSTPFRWALFGGVLALAATIIGVGWWSARPQYIPLASDLSPSETAEIISKLESAGIPNRMNFSGSGVLVPKTRWNDARLAVGDVLSKDTADSPSTAASVLADPTMNRQRALQMKQAQLERSLLRMKALVSADVHIAQPEWTPFVREQRPTTASVVLGIRPGYHLTPEHAAAIVAMIAKSVEGLEPQNVTVTDLEGHVLSNGSVPGGTEISRNFDFRRQIEAELVTKAEIMLAEMLGDGKAIVRITADIDFTQTKRVETFYDPEGEVKKRETIESTVTSRGSSAGRGVVGSDANTAGASAPSVGTPVAENHEKTDTEFAHAMTEDTTVIAGGTIKRLTVAAMVDLTPPLQGEGEAPPSIDRTQIEEVIKKAVGFNAERSDQFQLVVTRLAGSSLTGVTSLDTVAKWEFFNSVVRNASLGIAAVVALIVGLLVVRQLKPIALPTASTEPDTGRSARLLDEISQQAQSHPEILARVISAWLDADGAAKTVAESASEKVSEETVAQRQAA